MEPYELDPHQMLKLRDMLDVAGVAYRRNDGCGYDGQSWRTYSPDFEIGRDGSCAAGFSCCLNPCTYGHEAGLLEVWAKGMGDFAGWLDANGVMGELRKAGIA